MSFSYLICAVSLYFTQKLFNANRQKLLEFAMNPKKLLQAPYVKLLRSLRRVLIPFEAYETFCVFKRRS